MTFVICFVEDIQGVQTKFPQVKYANPNHQLISLVHEYGIYIVLAPFYVYLATFVHNLKSGHKHLKLVPCPLVLSIVMLMLLHHIPQDTDTSNNKYLASTTSRRKLVATHASLLNVTNLEMMHLFFCIDKADFQTHTFSLHAFLLILLISIDQKKSTSFCY